MIPFHLLKKIKQEKPIVKYYTIYEEHKDLGKFLYSDVCFVKNKNGYILARYMYNEAQNLEYWTDMFSTHPLTTDDEWCELEEASLAINNQELINPSLIELQKIDDFE